MSNTVHRSAYDMLYLCLCALTEQAPSRDRLSDIDLKSLYITAEFHSLTALVCEGLEKSDFAFSAEAEQYILKFQTAKEKAVRKNLLLDTERIRLLAYLEQNGIWYMPLKGVVLKDMYPKMGLRQMVDNDILFDKAYRQTVKEWFVKNGYQVKSYEKGNHDVYQKEPVFNYEMHISLFGDLHDEKWHSYYENIKNRLVRNDGTNYAYHFTDEDFYIYIMTHGFKHYDGGGTGIRFLLDMYVYLTRHTEMDLAYIERELTALGVAEFEQNCRGLITALFESSTDFETEGLSNEQQRILEYFLLSGAHGTWENYIEKGVAKNGRFGYFLRRAFPGPKIMQCYNPIYARHKWLLPIGWLYRDLKAVIFKTGKVFAEIKSIIKTKRK